MNTPDRSSRSSTHGISIALLIVAVAGLFWALQLRGRLDAREKELADAQKNTTSAATFADNKALRGRVQELEARLAAAQANLAPAAPGAATPAPAADSLASGLTAAVSAIMSNPAMRSSMSEAARRSLEMRYGELMTRMQLSPEDRTRFLELLVANQDLSRDASMKLMAAKGDTSERSALAAELQKASLAATARVKEFLGDLNYAEYQNFNQQQALRTQTATLNTTFNQGGEPLAPDVATSLMALQAEERKSFVYSNDINADDADPASVLDDVAVDTYFKESQQLADRIANRASAVLTPSQLAVFRKYQSDQLKGRRSTIDFGRQILGGQPAPK